MPLKYFQVLNRKRTFFYLYFLWNVAIKLLLECDWNYDYHHGASCSLESWQLCTFHHLIKPIFHLFINTRYQIPFERLESIAYPVCERFILILSYIILFLHSGFFLDVFRHIFLMHLQCPSSTLHNLPILYGQSHGHDITSRLCFNQNKETDKVPQTVSLWINILPFA